MELYDYYSECMVLARHIYPHHWAMNAILMHSGGYNHERNCMPRKVSFEIAVATCFPI